MPKALLIAEKPSLMRTIQDVYNKHKGEISYDITFLSQRGHLVTLKLPHEIEEDRKKWKWENLPFHPEEHGGWQYKVIQEARSGKNMTAKERFDQIKKELSSGSYDFVINAGDPDQEGELLVRIVLEYVKNKLPVKRFWTNDLTESHVLDALQNLKDDDRDPLCTNLYAAAKGRQHSDYRFGMNLTEAATLKMQARVACGRVKTPILAIVCRREEEIRNFKPKTVYGIESKYAEGFSGTLFDQANISSNEDDEEDKKEGITWFETKSDAQTVLDSLPKVATVLSCEKKRNETYAPKLYKLATLQVDAGKKGYNDAYTLQIIQGLYEKELLSYPRTDCEYLSSNENFVGILKAVQTVPELAPYISGISSAVIGKVRHTKKWINDKALEEAGHSAIRPTTKAPDFNTMTKDEQEIYTMVCRRFVAMFLPPVVQDKVLLIAEAGDKTFKSRGKTLVDPGYSVIFGTKFTDMEIPEKEPGAALAVEEYQITEKTSTCPKRYTSPGLVEVCESPAKFLDDASLKALGKRLKIGTSATRSSIIRQLITVDKYLEERKEKSTTYIVPTATGEAIIKNLGTCDICKVDLTGMWEEKLEMVRTGAMSLDDFERGMKTHVEDLIKDIKDKEMSSVGTTKYAVVGTCPVCGKELCEGAKGFFCMGFRSDPKCGVGMYKDFLGSSINKDEFLSLMKGEEVIKTLHKESNSWSQRLKYNFDTCKLDFVTSDEEEIGKCPKCGKKLLMGDRGFHCETACVKGYRNFLGTVLAKEEILSVLDGGKVTKTLQKNGRSWEQDLAWDFKEGRLSFVQAEAAPCEHVCPLCGKKMNQTGAKLECGCGLVVWRNFFSHTLTDEELGDLLTKKQTIKIAGLSGRSGKVFSARAVIDEEEKKVVPGFD